MRTSWPRHGPRTSAQRTLRGPPDPSGSPIWYATRRRVVGPFESRDPRPGPPGAGQRIRTPPRIRRTPGRPNAMISGAALRIGQTSGRYSTHPFPWVPGAATRHDDSLTIRSRAARGRTSRPRPARRRTAANQRRTPGFARRRRPGPPGAGIGFVRRGGLASFGAGDWVRLAPGIGFVWRRGLARSAPVRAHGADIPERRSALLARPGSLGAARGSGLAPLGAGNWLRSGRRIGSLGAGDWLRSAPGIGFARRRELASLGAGDWLHSA